MHSRKSAWADWRLPVCIALNNIALKNIALKKNFLGVTDAKESDGAVVGGFERCDMDRMWNHRESLRLRRHTLGEPDCRLPGRPQLGHFDGAIEQSVRRRQGPGSGAAASLGKVSLRGELGRG